MASTARLGSFEDLFAELPSDSKEGIAAIAWKLRELIVADFTEATEVVRLGDGAATYGLGPKKMSQAYVYIMPKASYVNLGFFYATSLADPAQLLEGSGKKMRHVKIHSVLKADQPEIAELITQARIEREQALSAKG